LDSLNKHNTSKSFTTVAVDDLGLLVLYGQEVPINTAYQHQRSVADHSHSH
jgi:hypothetical protein